MAVKRLNSNMVGAGDVSNAEHAYLNSVSSNIQTQVTNAAATPALPAVGSSGNVLTSDGTNWASAAAGGGAWSVITRTEASNQNSVSFTGFNSSTYGGYKVLIRFVQQYDNTRLYMRVSSNGGSSYDSGGSDYKFAIATFKDDDSSVSVERSGSSSIIQLRGANMGNQSGENGSYEITTISPDKVANTYFLIHSAIQWDTGQLAWANGSACRNTASAVNAIQIYSNNGNITNGEFTFLGLKKS